MAEVIPGTWSALRSDGCILGWPPKELSPNARVHWKTKWRAGKQYKLACWAEAKKAGLVVDWDGPISIGITFVPPSRRHHDLDNCIASIKAGLDGLALALRVNDSRFVMEPAPKLAAGIGGFVIVRIGRP